MIIKYINISLKFSAKIQKKCPITLDSFQKNAKKVNFFTKFTIFGENRREKRHFLRRVRDWNGQTWYTTCAEPLQSPTDIALERMICRTMEERPNKNSRTKYQGASRAKDQAAGGAEDTPARLEKARRSEPSSTDRTEDALVLALRALRQLGKRHSVNAVHFPVLLVLACEIRGRMTGNVLKMLHDGLG